MRIEYDIFLILYEFFIQYNIFPQPLIFYSYFFIVYEFCSCLIQTIVWKPKLWSLIARSRYGPYVGVSTDLKYSLRNLNRIKQLLISHSKHMWLVVTLISINILTINANSIVKIARHRVCWFYFEWNCETQSRWTFYLLFS